MERYHHTKLLAKNLCFVSSIPLSYTVQGFRLTVTYTYVKETSLFIPSHALHVSALKWSLSC